MVNSLMATKPEEPTAHMLRFLLGTCSAWLRGRSSRACSFKRRRAVEGSTGEDYESWSLRA